MGTLQNLLAFARLRLSDDAQERRHRAQRVPYHTPLQSYPSTPWPQRLSAQDTRAYRQPQPSSHDNYLTFWFGNQLPGAYMHITPHTAWIPVQSQTDTTPRLAGGSFGPVMTQLETAQLVATWRATWNSLASRY